MGNTDSALCDSSKNDIFLAPLVENTIQNQHILAFYREIYAKVGIMVLNLYKKEGETPLACMERFRAENPQYLQEKMTYAGRLDPMAEGVLLVLTRDDVYKKDEYLGLPKEYEFEVLFGFETDTYDILGLPLEGELRKIGKTEIEEVAEKFIGEYEQTYPRFSSKPVDGVPLFAIARGEGIADVDLPKRIVTISKIDFISERIIPENELAENILERIAKVQGDFRQEAICTAWKNILEQKKDEQFQIVKMRIACGSGTYVRVVAHELGKLLGVNALAYKITRTKVGEYFLES